jgi:hypothetical protein
VAIWNLWRKEYPEIEIDLSVANLRRAGLTRTSCVGTNFSGTTVTGYRVYGIASWERWA